MSTTLTQLKYTQITRDIRAIIKRGREDAQKALQHQILATNWEVGKYLTENLPLEEAPSAKNAKTIKHLARTFDQNEVYFYMVMKFYRYYPNLPKNGSLLSWSHYLALIGIDDARKRMRYEKLSIKEKLNCNKLGALIAVDRTKPQTAALKRGATKGLNVTRGKLHHYILAGPKKNEGNNGIATIDVGFSILRDIAISRQSNMHAGLMVHTVPTVILSVAKDLNIKKQNEKHNFTVKLSNASRDCLYTYKAQVERIIDGDTLVCMIDLGLKTKTRQKLRLRGINCPEMTTKRGKYVKDYVRKLLGKQDYIIVKTYKDDKYGRMLADVFYKNSECKVEPYIPKKGKKPLRAETEAEAVVEKGTFLNQTLLDEGFAEVWRG